MERFSSSHVIRKSHIKHTLHVIIAEEGKHRYSHVTIQSVVLNFSTLFSSKRLPVDLYDYSGLADMGGLVPQGLGNILVHLHANLTLNVY